MSYKPGDRVAFFNPLRGEAVVVEVIERPGKTDPPRPPQLVLRTDAGKVFRRRASLVSPLTQQEP